MNKKEEILKKSLILFSEEGYDNVGIQKIVNNCNITKPTLYYYFGSKEGLLEELIKNHLSDFFLNLESKIDYNENIVLSLEKIIFHFMNFAKNNSRFYRLFINLAFSPEKSTSYNCIKKYLVEEYSIIEKVFINAEKFHGNMKGKSKIFTSSFIGVMNSMASYYLFTKNEKDISEENSRNVCKQFIYGIFS